MNLVFDASALLAVALAERGLQAGDIARVVTADANWKQLDGFEVIAVR